MKPYYQDSAVTIYHGDCEDVMWGMDRVDFIFADPPYGVGFQYANSSDKRDGYTNMIPKWFAMFDGTNTAVTPGIVNVCFWPQPRWILAWIKNNSMGASGMSGPNMVSRNLWEPILWYGTYPPRQISRDTIKAPIAIGGKNGHPCPKPIELMMQIVDFASDVGQTILDPFMGSGTTLRASKDLGRKAIGIEIEEKYCEIAARRMEQEVLPLVATPIAAIQPALIE